MPVRRKKIPKNHNVEKEASPREEIYLICVEEILRKKEGRSLIPNQWLSLLRRLLMSQSQTHPLYVYSIRVYSIRARMNGSSPVANRFA